MALVYDPCGPNNLGCIDPDEIRDFFQSVQAYPAGLIPVSLEWLVSGPFTVDPSTPTTPQHLTVVDPYSNETFTECERVRLRCDLSDVEKLSWIGSEQKVTLRLGVSDGQSFDASFTLEVREK